jgi:hypothetical protein
MSVTPETPTPETDAAEWSWYDDCTPENEMIVPANIARKLERERNEARAERDILKLKAQREAEHHDRMVGELEKVYKERDEARAVAYDLAVIASHCLGSHGSALLTETSERIADTLKRWRELKQ